MLQSLRRYCSIYAGLFRASLSADLQFRTNFTIRIVTDILWYVANILVFEVLFLQMSDLKGWSIQEMRVFLGVLFVVDAFWMIFFSENLDQLSDKIRKGDLDLLLAKPVQSQFMMSCQKVSSAYIGNLLLAFFWLWLSLAHYPADLNPWAVGSLAFSIPLGLLLIYSVRFFFAASALYITRAENLNYLWFQLYRLGMRPESLYPDWLKVTTTTIFPVAFIASVPTQVAIQMTSPAILLWAAVLSILFLWFTTLFWRRGLRAYSSASS
ncbi:MAG: ABC-2 family transporter protein [Bdellovibrionales bacterium]|nr:ABC-2 family transporter protein [Bdellovibrionales bacterium]